MYMEDARFKDKRKTIRNNSGERMGIVSWRSKLVVYGITQCNVSRTERQYFVLPD